MEDSSALSDQIAQTVALADTLQAGFTAEELANPSVLQRLGREHGEEQVRAAVEQVVLRNKAAAKFCNGDRMYFVADALEQATPEAVARYHASLFPEGALVADLTAGIGSDLIAIAARGPAMGFEIDPLRVAAANFNLKRAGAEACVSLQDSLEAEVDAVYIYADPARREGGARTLRIEEFEPDPRVIAEKFADSELLVIRTTPMLSDQELSQLGSRIVFVSHRGKCIEALCISGTAVAGPGDAEVAAYMLDADEYLVQSPIKRAVAEPGAYIHDLDPAAVRANAGGAIAEDQLGTHPARVTSDSPYGGPWATSYKVVRYGSFRTKRIKQDLRELGARVEVVKSAGASVEPEGVRREIDSKGQTQLVLHVYSAGKQLRYALSELPLASDAADEVITI